VSIMNIAEQMFLVMLDSMKEVLEIGEFKFGKGSTDYKLFKKQIMNIFYNNVKNLFRKLEKEDILQRCECRGNVRHGYTECKSCHGAGFVQKVI